MKSLNKHIILIGFKHVGKTVVGKHLATALNVPFIDLDARIELLYEKESGGKLSSREIMVKSGQDYFRHLETNALRGIIPTQPSVISLGGGSLSTEENQILIKDQLVVHITAPRGIVFERIMMGGRPAFFDPDEDLLVSFNKLYDERIHTYEKLCNLSIMNNGPIETTVQSLMEKLS